MMIIDAIDGATNRHAVYFLVTAYIESLSHFHRGMGIPEPVVRLPVEGIADLESRLACLHGRAPAAPGALVPADEVSAVLASAVNRLAGESAQSAENR